MRIAVAGATGHIGALTVAALEQGGHDVIRISRSLGVDLRTGDGLDAALAAVEAVVDATSAEGTDRDEVVATFGAATGNLLAAEHRAGVRHHVLLSIVGLHRVEGNPHYAGKREQERLVEAGPVPWTIVPATQFHDFAATVTGWAERDGVATIAPLLVQPIAPADITRSPRSTARARARPRRGPRDAGSRRHRRPEMRGPARHGREGGLDRDGGRRLPRRLRFPPRHRGQRHRPGSRDRTRFARRRPAPTPVLATRRPPGSDRASDTLPSGPTSPALIRKRGWPR